MELGLTEWSLRTRFNRKYNPMRMMDFPCVTYGEFGLKAVELYNVWLKSFDLEYLEGIRTDAAHVEVDLWGMSVDGTGNLSSLNEEERKIAITNANAYCNIAKHLGLPYFRVNTGGEPREKWMLQKCIDSYQQLASQAERYGVKIVIENHGGVSTDPDAIVQIIKEVDSKWIGTLPDFGNFDKEIVYEGISKIAPYAVACHAKFIDFDESGEEKNINMKRMLKVLRDCGFDGKLAIEWGGSGDDHEGILKGIALIKKYI